MTKDKLNGSVEALAVAMRQVFSEAVEGAIQPVLSRLDAMDSRFDKIDGQLDAMDRRLINIEGQVSYHQKALDGIKNKLPYIIASEK